MSKMCSDRNKGQRQTEVGMSDKGGEKGTNNKYEGVLRFVFIAVMDKYFSPTKHTKIPKLDLNP